MSNWKFRGIGTFASAAEVDHWARKNGVSARDIKTRRGRDGGIEAEVRESAYDESDDNTFGSFSRGSGFR